MELIRFVLFLAAVSAIALAVVAASQSTVDLPVALSAVTAGLGILAVVLIVFRIISPPDSAAPATSASTSVAGSACSSA